MAGKGKFGEFVEGQARGALENLADLFAMPKVKQSMVDDALESPETLDALNMEPEDIYDLSGDVNAAYDAIFGAPGSKSPALADFYERNNEDLLSEMTLFVEKGIIPKGEIAKSMVESLFDSGLKDTEARFFMDAKIPDIIKPESGTFMEE